MSNIECERCGCTMCMCSLEASDYTHEQRISELETQLDTRDMVIDQRAQQIATLTAERDALRELIGDALGSRLADNDERVKWLDKAQAALGGE